MNSFVALLLSSLLLYKYWALFGVIFAAAIILPLPTNTLLLATGAFASQGYFNLFFSLAVAVVANILGDCIDFLLARRYGHRALRMLHIRLPSYVTRLERFVRQHTGPTIFVTRFIGTVEEVVSFLAGFVGVPFGIFLLYDFLGNLVSIGAVIYAGYLLGIHWQDVTALFGLAGWILLGISVLAAVAISVWYSRRHT